MIKQIKIKRSNHSDETYLPISHTCFNQLELPQYQTEQQLKSKLLEAIQHCQQFGLAWTITKWFTSCFFSYFLLLIRFTSNHADVWRKSNRQWVIRQIYRMEFVLNTYFTCIFHNFLVAPETNDTYWVKCCTGNERVWVVFLHNMKNN